MTTEKAIRNAIIALLTTQAPKNAANKVIVKWFSGEPPPSRYPGFPWGFVAWLGFAATPPFSLQKQISDEFQLVIVDKSLDQDKAEDSVLEFVESIQTALKTDTSLGGTVRTSWPRAGRKQKLFEAGTDYSIVAAELILTTRRKE